MTLQDLIATLNNLASSKPELLAEQVSILEPDTACGYEICQVEESFINNARYEVCSLQELEEEFEEEDRKDFKKSVILMGFDPQSKDKHWLPLRSKNA